MKKNLRIGFIYFPYGKHKANIEDHEILNSIRKKAIAIKIPTDKSFKRETLKSFSKKCDIILNGDASSTGLEVAKTLEEFGSFVVNPTRTFHYNETKWMFYVKCRKNKILTPKTILLPESNIEIKKILKTFLKEGPVVIKNIQSFAGESVGRSKTISGGIKLVTKFRELDNSPLIAQKFIKSSNKTLRVTVIGGKAVQCVEKIGNTWKCTGLSGYLRQLDLTPQIKKISLKISKMMGQTWCGIDFIESNGKLYAIEANGRPAIDFESTEIKKLADLLVEHLIKLAKK